MANPPPNPLSTNVPETTIDLDGRTLEGGGQLVRNALALSALTGQAVSIHHIRGNREGKKGLKGSHLEAIKLLAEVTESEVTGAELGSLSLRFSPQKKHCVSDDIDSDECTEHPVTGKEPQSRSLQLLCPKPIQSEYTIRLPTAGSVFLVFQALYPYLLYAGAFQGRPIRLNLTGGTNVSFSPSYDYISQVLIPNFAKLGLPQLSVQLQKRGWATGPVDLGTVTFVIHPVELPSPAEQEHMVDGDTEDEKPETDLGSTASPRFPSINITKHHRGKITKIDITILAPDSPVSAGRSSKDIDDQSNDSRRSDKTRESDHEKPSTPKQNKLADPGQDHHPNANPDNQHENSSTEVGSTRQYIQTETLKHLHEKLKSLLGSTFDTQFNSSKGSPERNELTIPITVHTTEPTSHRSQIYILLVAHTSTGFKLGHDALFGTNKGETIGKKGRGKPSNKMEQLLQRFMKRCVDGFIEELQDPNTGGKKASCLDVYMRDQVVVFEALGRLYPDWDHDRMTQVEQGEKEEEDEARWSLHTQTARWVCKEILGVKW